MNHAAMTSRRYGHLALFALALLVAYRAPSALTAAQTTAQTAVKKALTVDDYARWRSINGQEISGDGKWVTYGLSFSNTAPTDAKRVARPSPARG